MNLEMSHGPSMHGLSMGIEYKGPVSSYEIV